ncbi:MAG TPA: orotidine-5'-phosphate decarboxylase [Patescibacteria group bacterium]|nr:orotidine-5'-phosphate decarboxylase [Patescibacteria group bacterium]
MLPKERILVALDTNDIGRLNALAKTLGPHVGGFKIGLEALFSIGLKPALNAMRGYGPATDNIFVDAKLHDIPNTMERALRSIVEHPQVKFVNVHASAGVTGVSVLTTAKGQAKLLAVTVLTSFDDDACKEVYRAAAPVAAKRLAELVGSCLIDGLVCSPKEVPLFRADPAFDRLVLVTPGVRPKWSTKDDQERVATPGEAVRAGADYLVIGRPITNPPSEIGSPAAAAKLIAEEIAAATAHPFR